MPRKSRHGGNRKGAEAQRFARVRTNKYLISFRDWPRDGIQPPDRQAKYGVIQKHYRNTAQGTHLTSAASSSDGRPSGRNPPTPCSPPWSIHHSVDIRVLYVCSESAGAPRKCVPLRCALTVLVQLRPEVHRLRRRWKGEQEARLYGQLRGLRPFRSDRDRHLLDQHHRAGGLPLREDLVAVLGQAEDSPIGARPHSPESRRPGLRAKRGRAVAFQASAAAPSSPSSPSARPYLFSFECSVSRFSPSARAAWVRFPPASSRAATIKPRS